MNLTTMKISVPVLMFMMFQSGYCVSDWFTNAWVAMNQGKKADAYAIVQEVRPEKVGKLSPEQKEEFQKNWSKTIFDAVSNILPLYYYGDDGKLIPAGEPHSGVDLRNSIVELDNEVIKQDDHEAFYHFFLDPTAEDAKEITAANVSDVLLNKVIGEVYDGETKLMDTTSAWLLMDEGLVAEYDPDHLNQNEDKGVFAWAGRIAAEWGIGEYTGDNAKKLLMNKEDAGEEADPCPINLRNNIKLVDGENETDPKEVSEVFDIIKDKAKAAHDAIGGETYSVKLNDLLYALSGALKDVLADRIKTAAGEGTYDPAADEKHSLEYFIQSGFDRKEVGDTSTTVIDYGTSGAHDPLAVISSKAGTTLNSDSISKAVIDVIDADLSLLLRHDGTVSYKDLDSAVFASAAAAEREPDQNDFIAGLKAVTQSFSSGTTKTVVSDLKAIKNPQNS